MKARIIITINVFIDSDGKSQESFDGYQQWDISTVTEVRMELRMNLPRWLDNLQQQELRLSLRVAWINLMKIPLLKCTVKYSKDFPLWMFEISIYNRAKSPTIKTSQFWSRFLALFIFIVCMTKFLSLLWVWFENIAQLIAASHPSSNLRNRTLCTVWGQYT